MRTLKYLVITLLLCTSAHAGETICCFGGAHIDNIFVLKKQAVLENANHAHLNSYVGGVGYNMAHLIKRKVPDVAMVSIVGTDASGEKVLQTLELEGIDHNNVIRNPNHPTTIYSALHNPDGSLEIAAIDTEIYKQFKPKMLEPKMPNLIQAKAWVLDSTFQPEIYAYLATIKNKPPTYATICSINEVKNFSPILKNIDILFGNVDEISLMAESADKTDDGIWNSLEKIAKKGVKTTVCTHGPNGIFVLDKGKRYRMPAIPVTITESTNGTGDALAAGVIVSLVENQSFETALQNGLQAAADHLSKT